MVEDITRVDNSIDDCDEQQTFPITINTTGQFLELKSSNTNVGLIFGGGTVPQGAIIDSANLNMRLSVVTCAGGNNCTNSIKGVAMDNITGGWNDTTQRPGGVPKTTANVTWTENDDLSPNGFRSSNHNVKAIVQEITDRGGWSAGNNMAFVIAKVSMGFGRFISIAAYDLGTPPSSARATLTINYSERRRRFNVTFS